MAAKTKAIDFMWDLTMGVTCIGGQSCTPTQEALQLTMQKLIDLNLPSAAYAVIADAIMLSAKIGKGEPE